MNQVIKQEVERVFFKHEKDGIKMVKFSELRKDDIFSALDNGSGVVHENGKDNFIATTNPYLQNGIPMIGIKTC